MGKKSVLPSKGSHCGLRPNPDAANAGIDFSGAKDLIEEIEAAEIKDQDPIKEKKSNTKKPT